MAVFNQENQNDDLAQSLYDDTSNAIHMGKDAARTAKQISQFAQSAGKAGGAVAKGTAAAKGAAAVGGATAASGGATAAAGAGVAAGGGTVVAVIAGILLAFTLISFLYALPNAVFEPIQNVFETWDETYYADQDGGNRLMTVLRFTGGMLSDAAEGVVSIVQSAWSAITSWFDSEESSYTNEYDMTVVSQELAERLSIVKKAVAVNDKYLVRANQITSEVSNRYYAVDDYLYQKYDWNASKNEDRNWKETIVSYEIVPMGTDKNSSPSSTSTVNSLESIVKNLRNARTEEDLDAAKSSFMNTLNNGFPSVTSSGQSNMEAISLMYLCSTQLGGSVESMKLSDFMRWLGYTGNGTTTFNIGHIPEQRDAIYGSVPAWNGTFKPQYLMEEQKYYQNELILARCYGDETEISRLEGIVSQYKNSGMPVMDLMVELDYPQLNYRSLGSAAYREWTSYYRDTTIEHRETTFVNPSGKAGTLKLHEWEEYTPTPFGVQVDKYCQFTIQYYVRPRNASSVMSMIGLWSGDFATGGVNNSQAQDPAY